MKKSDAQPNKRRRLDKNDPLKEKQVGLELFPDAIFKSIFSSSDIQTLLNTAVVSKRWQAISYEALGEKLKNLEEQDLLDTCKHFPKHPVLQKLKERRAPTEKYLQDLLNSLANYNPQENSSIKHISEFFDLNNFTQNLEKFIILGGNINEIKTEIGQTYLHVIFSTKLRLVTVNDSYVYSTDLIEKILSLLLKHEANPNILDNHSRSVLHLAVEYLKLVDSYDMRPLIVPMKKLSITLIEMLLKAGATPNSQDEDGNTPLHYAAKIPQDDYHENFKLQIITCLLKNNAFANILNKENQAPWQICAMHQETALTLKLANQAMIENNYITTLIYDINNDIDPDDQEEIKKASDALVDKINQIKVGKLTFNSWFNEKQTLMHCLVEDFVGIITVPLLEKLLSFGANVNGKDKNGDTILHYIVHGWFHSPIFYPQFLMIAKFLLEHGADFNIKNNEGKSSYMAITYDYAGDGDEIDYSADYRDDGYDQLKILFDKFKAPENVDEKDSSDNFGMQIS